MLLASELVCLVVWMGLELPGLKHATRRLGVYRRGAPGPERQLRLEVNAEDASFGAENAVWRYTLPTLP